MGPVGVSDLCSGGPPGEAGHRSRRRCSGRRDDGSQPADLASVNDGIRWCEEEIRPCGADVAFSSRVRNSGCLGRGAWASFRRGTVPETDGAAKMILAGSHAGEHERDFARREAVARLQHPGIADPRGRRACRAPFCAWSSLRSSLAQKLEAGLSAGLLPAWSRRRSHTPSADRNVVHRDLKPANILLSVASVHRRLSKGECFQPTNSG